MTPWNELHVWNQQSATQSVFPWHQYDQGFPGWTGRHYDSLLDHVWSLRLTDKVKNKNWDIMFVDAYFHFLLYNMNYLSIKLSWQGCLYVCLLQIMPWSWFCDELKFKNVHSTLQCCAWTSGNVSPDVCMCQYHNLIVFMRSVVPKRAHTHTHKHKQTHFDPELGQPPTSNPPG